MTVSDSDSIRVMVQNTFIEVVGGRQQDAHRRVRSAPAGLSQQADQAPGQDPDWRCAEGLTTVVLRNLPEDYSRELLLDILNVHDFGGKYDFVYMPVDFSSGLTFGFAFINLTAPEHAARFRADFEGFASWQLDCPHAAAVNWSATQGLDALVDLHRNSPVMHESVPDECRPLVFRGGVRAPFPPPTRKILPPKRQRRRYSVRSDTEDSSSAASSAESSRAAAQPNFLLGALVPASDPVAKARLKHNPLLGVLTPLGQPAAAPAPSWADTSESIDEDEYLSEVLLPGLTSWLAMSACQHKDLEDHYHSECSTDAGSSQRLQGSESQLTVESLASAAPARGGATARPRGKRAGRKTTKSISSSAPWTGGSFLMPGLVAAGPLCAGAPRRDDDEHEAP